MIIITLSVIGFCITLFFSFIFVYEIGKRKGREESWRTFKAALNEALDETGKELTKELNKVIINDRITFVKKVSKTLYDCHNYTESVKYLQSIEKEMNSLLD